MKAEQFQNDVNKRRNRTQNNFNKKSPNGKSRPGIIDQILIDNLGKDYQNKQLIATKQEQFTRHKPSIDT